MPSPPTIRLPRHRPEHVKSGILHAISLAGVVLSYARGLATGHRWPRAQLEQAEAEIALLREELNTELDRFSSIGWPIMRLPA